MAFSGEPRRVLCFVVSEAWCSAAATGRSPQRLGQSSALGTGAGLTEEPAATMAARSPPGPMHGLRSSLLSLLCQWKRHFETGLLFISEPASILVEQIVGSSEGLVISFCRRSLQLHVCRRITRLCRVVFLSQDAWNWAQLRFSLKLFFFVLVGKISFCK